MYVNPEERGQSVADLHIKGYAAEDILHLHKKDGTEFWAADTVIAIYDKEGNMKWMDGVIEDITDRLQTEEELRKSEERYRRLVDLLPDAVTVSDLEGNIILTNQQNAIMLGYDDPSEIIGINAFDIFPEEEKERAQANTQKTLDEEIVKNIKYTLKRKDGSTFQAELSASVLEDRKGNPEMFIAVTRDITER